MEPVTVTIGNFLFRFRNQVFPLAIIALFGASMALLDRAALLELRAVVQRGGKSAKNAA